MTYEVTLGGKTRTVTVRRGREGWCVSLDGGPERHLRADVLGPAEWRLEEAGVVRVVGLAAGASHVDLQIGGHAWRATVTDPRKDALELGAAGGAGVLVTDMPGAVVRLLVAEGQAVTLGEPLLVVEAMKMENELKAPIAGVVAMLHVAAGDRVESGATLLTITPEEA